MIYLAPFSVGRHGASQAPHTILGIRNGETHYHPKIVEIPVHHHDPQATSRNVEKVLIGKANYLVIGGDHSITAGIVRARAQEGPVHVVMFDAHTDDYESEYVDSVLPLHSGNWLKVVQDENLVSGITMVTHRGKVPKEYSAPVPKFGRVHVTVDIDVVTPADIGYATAYPEAGGCSLKRLLDDLKELNLGTASVTADFVEYDPTRDANQAGGFASSKIVSALLDIIGA